MPFRSTLPTSIAPGNLPAQRRRGARMLGGRASLFDDENLDVLAHVLDDCFRVPFTRFRFGIDGVIGLIPGLGDVLAGLAGLVLIVAAWVRGVPYVTLVRMTANLALAVVVGSVPLFGDAFDVWWKPNRRNYRLLTRYLVRPDGPTWRDWCFLAFLLGCLFAAFALPIVLLVWLLWELRRVRIA